MRLLPRIGPVGGKHLRPRTLRKADHRHHGGVINHELLDVFVEPETKLGDDGLNVILAGNGGHVESVQWIKGLSYAYPGENFIVGRLLFCHQLITPPCHGYFVRVASDFWSNLLLFRSNLRIHDEAAAEYS